MTELMTEISILITCAVFFVFFFVDDPEPDDGYNYKQMMARDERRFKMADGNGDHIADKEEFTAFLHPEEYEHMKDIVVLVGLLLLFRFYPRLKWLWNLFASHFTSVSWHTPPFKSLGFCKSREWIIILCALFRKMREQMNISWTRNKGINYYIV